MTPKAKFNLGGIVFLVTDAEQKGIVTGLVQRPGASAMQYLVTFGSEESSHFECELTDEKTFAAD